MRIIVEGPDGGGKTTLVKYLAEAFDFKIVVNEKGPDQNLEWWWPETLFMNENKVPIHDRFFYSELVYGPIIRGRLAVPDHLINSVRSHLQKDALLIYARPDRSALELGVRVEKQMEGVAQKFTELVEAYDHLMQIESWHYGTRFYTYRWTNILEPQTVVEFVKRYVRGELR